MVSSKETRGEVLVAIMNNLQDFSLLRDHYWYRIPVASMEKWLKKRWPPKWLAFYQTNVFGHEAHSVRYFGEVADIKEVYRHQLFPDAKDDERDRRYYQVFLESIQQLPEPIFSRRFRRIVFIPTTWEKFTGAVEINDLFDESVLEDKLWAEFKRLSIPAERQEYVTARGNDYALDFAIYCNKGKIDVEANGDYWHSNKTKAALDNIRDNDLKTAGWQVLRFSGTQIQEDAANYCATIVAENINKLEGPDEKRIIPRHIDLTGTGEQLSLFDDVQ